MGNYKIIIEGVGSHHNSNDPADADVMAVDFVKALQGKGHSISKADFETQVLTDQVENLLARVVPTPVV